MVSNPHQGQLVRVWYRASMRAYMPHHGRLARVDVVSKGRPRNHGVVVLSIGHIRPIGRLGRPTPIAVPAGNLQPLTWHDLYLIHTRRVRGGWCAAYIHSDGRMDWRTVLGTHRDRAAAIDAARLAIDVRLQGGPGVPLNPVPDARDRRRSLWWHKEAKRRRELLENQEARP